MQKNAKGVVGHHSALFRLQAQPAAYHRGWVRAFLLVNHKTDTTLRSCSGSRLPQPRAVYWLEPKPSPAAPGLSAIVRITKAKKTLRRRRASSRCTVYWSISKPSLGFLEPFWDPKIMSAPLANLPIISLLPILNFETFDKYFLHLSTAPLNFHAFGLLQNRAS